MTPSPTPPTSEARLALRNVSKRYASVVANDGIDLTVAPGEIHAVLGENGAGKSTLMKVIYGAVKPDSGEMRWNGELVKVASPRAARALGISMVFQHFSLFETLTVAENVWLGLDATFTLADVTRRIQAFHEEYGLEMQPERTVSMLSVGERQRVEIARALLTDPKLLILDEPTSVLTPQAVERLFVLLRRLSDKGCSILYISHKLDEVRALCHRCTVLRSGRVTGEVRPAERTNAELSRLMMGSDLPAVERSEVRLGPVALHIDGLCIGKRRPFGVALSDIQLSVHAGEIVGVAGISGNGQAEFLAALSGEDGKLTSGRLLLLGQEVSTRSARQRRALGLHFVPEERLGRGAVPSLSLARNTLLTRSEPIGPGGFLRVGMARQLASHLIARFRVKADGPDTPASSLSGGNLQKFIVGREIDAAPKVLIVAQPTWGVDVGAAAQIRRELLALRDAGCALLLISEELDELFELSTRLTVMANGRLSPVIATRDATVEQIGEWMSGLWGPTAELPDHNPEALHA